MCRGESAAFILCGLAAGNACIVLRGRRACAAGTKGLRPLDSHPFAGSAKGLRPLDSHPFAGCAKGLRPLDSYPSAGCAKGLCPLDSHPSAGCAKGLCPLDSRPSAGSAKGALPPLWTPTMLTHRLCRLRAGRGPICECTFIFASAKNNADK